MRHMLCVTCYALLVFPTCFPFTVRVLRITGWLGILTSSLLYISYREKDNFKKSTEKLATEIEKHAVVHKYNVSLYISLYKWRALVVYKYKATLYNAYCILHTWQTNSEIWNINHQMFFRYTVRNPRSSPP